MIPLLLALANCPKIPTDTVAVIPKALIWMSLDTAVVAKSDDVIYEYVDEGDTAVTIYRDCQKLVTLKNTLTVEDTIPDADQLPIWRGGGLAVVFVAPRVHPVFGKVELVGVLVE